MNIGTLDRRITLRTQAAGQDAVGQPLTGWTTVATVWGNIRYISGVEAVKSNAVTSIAQASIRIRYRAGITAGMQAVDDASVVYNIKTPLPNKRKGYLDLVCEATS